MTKKPVIVKRFGSTGIKDLDTLLQNLRDVTRPRKKMMIVKDPVTGLGKAVEIEEEKKIT